MNSEWREVLLGEIATVKGGKRLPKGVNLLRERNNHPYIRIRDLGITKSLKKNDEFEYVDDETQKSISRYIVNTDDIILSIVGTIGLVAKIDKSLMNANLTENCVKINELKNLDSDFLYYYLTSEKGQNEISKGTVGAVQPKLPIKNIQSLKIHLPNINMQKNISATLSCLDDKIELNSRMNKTLEEMAQAIFKSWFIDFEPFKDGEFVVSGLGRIPKGWRVGILGDLLDNIKSPVKPSNVTKLKPYVPIDCIPMHQIGLNDYKSGEEAQSSLSCFFRNDILIGAMRVYFHRVVIAPFEGITRTTCFVLRPKHASFLTYALLLCNLDKTIDYANSTSKGSTMPYAVWDDGLMNMKILLPPINEAISFHDIVSPIIEKIRDMLFENMSLKSLRDILLPKLMSGEIRVPVQED